jgi:hypothetical protein
MCQYGIDMFPIVRPLICNAQSKAHIAFVKSGHVSQGAIAAKVQLPPSPSLVAMAHSDGTQNAYSMVHAITTQNMERFSPNNGNG